MYNPLNFLYFLYVIPAMVCLGFLAILLKDESFWQNISKNNPMLGDLDYRTKIYSITALLPLANIILAVSYIILVFCRWKDPENWDKW